QSPAACTCRPSGTARSPPAACCSGRRTRVQSVLVWSWSFSVIENTNLQSLPFRLRKRKSGQPHEPAASADACAAHSSDSCSASSLHLATRPDASRFCQRFVIRQGAVEHHHLKRCVPRDDYGPCALGHAFHL